MRERSARRMASEMLRMILGTVFMSIGLIIFIIEVFGIFKFKYVLNRMQVAAMGDTLGLSASLLGLAIISGLNFTTLKLAILIVFFWITSPICSHMLANMEVVINDKLADNVELATLEEIESREES